MRIEDFNGIAVVNTEDDLIARLKLIRHGKYGAFVLSHKSQYPALSVHTNQDIAYLHYFISDSHPGYQPINMTPQDCPEDVHFLQTNACEADAFDMPDYTLVTLAAAYDAAIEFFKSPDPPSAISWTEL